MAMKVLWAAVLLAYGAAMDSGYTAPIFFTLDMAKDSVDDVYHGCDVKMAEMVEKKYLQEEMKNEDFNKVWKDAEELYNKQYKGQITGQHSNLNREEAIAVYAYTSVKGSIHQPFNEAVRTQGPQYKSNFRFHALHFYLTKAVQRLRVSSCTAVYRRTTASFHDVEVGKLVRFGFFASCSKNVLDSAWSNAKKFGDASCFEVVTCLGGEVFEFSVYDNEAEVLIPPYEEFEVTDVKKKSELKDLPCDVVYKLKGIKHLQPNFNCALFSK